MGTRVLLTGGLGFIGSNLIELLLKKNYHVINIDKISYSSNFYNTKEFKNKAKNLMYTNRKKFSLSKMVTKLDEIMEKHTQNIPTQVGLQLPKLKKAGSEEKPKLELPKLKKITEKV